jgi:hypothetical protein
LPLCPRSGCLDDLLEPGGGHQPLPDFVPLGSRWACQSPTRFACWEMHVIGCRPSAVPKLGSGRAGYREPAELDEQVEPSFASAAR